MESYKAKRKIEKQKGVNSYVPVYILTAVFIVILALSEIIIFLDLNFSDELSGGLKLDMIFTLIWQNIYFKVSYLLLVLYVFFFRKNVVGAFMLPIIYIILGIKESVAIIKLFKSDLNTSVFASDDGIYFFILDSVFLVFYILMAVTAFKGFRPKVIIIVTTALICGYHIYNLVRYFITTPSAEELAEMGINFDFKMVFSDICGFLIPILFFVILMLIGLNKNTPSVIEAINNQRNKPKKKNEREIKKYEEDLEDLKIQLENGVISQKHYDEITADIYADIRDLKSQIKGE